MHQQFLKSCVKLPNKNGTSPDGISYRYLKNCWFTISPYLSEIFRASIDSGSIPEIWKSSIVVPIFKKGERNNPENYRPISLTCAICRVIERIIVTKIYEFLTRNKLISENQFGFLRNRSTTLQLIKTINDFSDAMENKKNIDCIYLDFQKAFDSVPHDLLLFKRRLIDIGGKLIQWISNFITNRKFTVKINESYSDDYHVTSGVPQGSVLGPVLFLIYINDLPDIIPVGISIKLFADDVKLYVTHKSNQERKQLELALINISQWCKEWKIKIAPTKSFVLHLGNNNPKHQYKLDQNIITEVQSIRDLGILIDNKLKFTEHISNIIKSAYYRMRLLFKYLKTRSIKIWKSVYTSYIRSLLEYSTVNWSPNSKKDINRLEKCQKFYTKIALKKCRLPYIRYQNRLTLFELPTLENRRKILDLVTIYKIINGYTCLDPKSLFNFSERSSS
uniref:Reverse transcriptase domain-containing protein n=1 Tax=Meloidogyne hapla TaxID=6305 RepID=A0A1I8BY63_MELHA